MRARTVRTQWRAVVASLTATMVLPFVGSGVSYGLPTEPGRLSTAMSGGYHAEHFPARATTTATFLVPEFDATDCGPTDEAWAHRFLARALQEGSSLVVQIWTHCSEGRLRSGGWMRDGSRTLNTPELSPGERVTVTTEGSRVETRLSVHNLDRDWIADITSESGPKGGITVVAEHVWDGDEPILERASFKRLKIDGRPFGEYDTERTELGCTRVSPLRQGTSFRVTHTCAP